MGRAFGPSPLGQGMDKAALQEELDRLRYQIKNRTCPEGKYESMCDECIERQDRLLHLRKLLGLDKP